MGDIFEDIFGVLFQVQMIWHKLLLKARGRLEMPMKIKIKIHLFWNVKGRLEVWKTIFFVFSSRKQGNKYVPNILLTPFKDLKSVYFAHQGLPYGKEDQMLFLDNELIKALQTLNVVVSSLNFLEDISCQIIRCSGWALLLICVSLTVIGKKNWHPLWNHCQILRVVFYFFTKLFLVHASYGKW